MSNNYKSTFLQKELFLLDTARADRYILYAPLADSVVLINQEEADRLARAIVDPRQSDDEALEVIEALCEVEPVERREGHVRSENEFINLSILPNNVCNFSCSYCYSAKGRSTTQIELSQLKQMIDYFISPERNNAPLLTVSIFGGGEPMLSWAKCVSPAIEYLYCRAKELERRVVTTIITNGSLIHDGLIHYCRQYEIDLVCSFDILREVQEVQRKHYDLVHNNLAILIENGVIPAINSVVTMLNVDAQSEMINTLHRDLPQIKYVSFEPVIDADTTQSIDFFDRFFQGFVRAQRLASHYGMVLTCSSLRNVDVTVDRYCSPELALCADGSITVCPCVSSSEEPNYDQYIYGKVTTNGVIIDHEKLHKLIAINVHSYPWCGDCFAKWNCAGGCINNNRNNSNTQNEAYCNFTRKFLHYILTQRLDLIALTETSKTIKEEIEDYEHFTTE